MVCCRGALITLRLGASSALLRPRSASSRKRCILGIIAGVRGTSTACTAMQYVKRDSLFGSQ